MTVLPPAGRARPAWHHRFGNSQGCWWWSEPATFAAMPKLRQGPHRVIICCAPIRRRLQALFTMNPDELMKRAIEELNASSKKEEKVAEGLITLQSTWEKASKTTKLVVVTSIHSPKSTTFHALHVHRTSRCSRNRLKAQAFQYDRTPDGAANDVP
jgi:hypothetical protein